VRGCDVCGSYRDYFAAGRVALCGEHLARRRSAWGVASIAVVVIVAAYNAAVRGQPEGPVVAWLVPALVAVVVVTQLLRVAVARLTGLRVGRVTLGIGPALLRAGRLVVRAIPYSGWAVLAPRGDPARWRWRLAYAGALATGPALDAALVAALFRTDAPYILAAGSVAALQWFERCYQLLDPGQRRYSDLSRIVRAVVRGAPVTVDLPSGWHVTHTEYFDALDEVRRVDRWRYEEVADRLAWLATVQPGGRWDYLIEVALVRQGRYEEARASALARLPGESEPRHRATTLNLIAWVDALAGTRPEEMADTVREALDLTPDDAAVLDTAALVAARQGRLDEAEDLCRRAEAADVTPAARDLVTASAASVRAYIALLRGDPDAAAEQAGLARAYDPTLPTLRLLA
jgi:tetratricopeptide (TPR) repeat protein